MNNLDATGHVTGKSVYLDDIPVLKNCLHGVVFCSPSAHGTITRLDISGAMSVPGVQKVLTWKDIPGRNDIGGIIPDEMLFAQDEVHFMGQPVALVVAGNEHIARKAAKLIKMEISGLEVITDPRLAKEKIFS